MIRLKLQGVKNLISTLTDKRTVLLKSLVGKAPFLYSCRFWNYSFIILRYLPSAQVSIHSTEIYDISFVRTIYQEKVLFIGTSPLAMF